MNEYSVGSGLSPSVQTWQDIDGMTSSRSNDYVNLRDNIWSRGIVKKWREQYSSSRERVGIVSIELFTVHSILLNSLHSREAISPGVQSWIRYVEFRYILSCGWDYCFGADYYIGTLGSVWG